MTFSSIFPNPLTVLGSGYPPPYGRRPHQNIAGRAHRQAPRALPVLRQQLETINPWLEDDQVEEVVKATIAEVGATTKTDMGKVMKAVQAKLAGRADNRLVSQLVSANLA